MNCNVEITAVGTADGLEVSMFEIINEMVKDCWAEKTAKTEAEKEAAVNQLKAFVAMFFEPEN